MEDKIWKLDAFLNSIPVRELAPSMDLGNTLQIEIS